MFCPLVVKKKSGLLVTKDGLGIKNERLAMGNIPGQRPGAGQVLQA
jgi:hypothetical protein